MLELNKLYNMEIWKDIKGYEGIYQVSNYGKVKSLDRAIWMEINNCFGKFKSNLLKQENGANGYPKVVLCKNNLPKTYLVHRLITIAFIPNPYNKPEVNHKNGIKIDNRLENLEWVTLSENHTHAYKIGLQKAYGENNGRAKLNSFQVRVIRKSKDSTGRELSVIFNISEQVICQILKNKIWKKY